MEAAMPVRRGLSGWSPLLMTIAVGNGVEQVAALAISRSTVTFGVVTTRWQTKISTA
jgi:hypothetical protein